MRSRALTYFDDADREATSPSGLTAEMWTDIKRWFTEHVSAELARRAGA